MQVGDPFTEKLLLEASLELITGGYIVAIQDMGAAGLTSSSAEMAARGGVGVELDTSKVPTREPGMTPYEIMLSESQERMLVVAEPHRLRRDPAVCRKWDLDATPIGQVTDDGIFRIVHDGPRRRGDPRPGTGRRLSDVFAAGSRVGRLRDSARAARATEVTAARSGAALETLLDAPSIASKRWVFEQYDGTVRAGSVMPPGGDAGVLRVADSEFGIAMTVDCNARHVLLDPYEGGKGAVAEAARNIACTGARPLGVTDCLNFGNPEKPEIFFQFVEACRGIADACRAFGTPVTGGNVSLYNQNPTGAIDPDADGRHDRPARRCHRRPCRATSGRPAMRSSSLGDTRGHLGGSAYWAEVLATVGGDAAADRSRRPNARLQQVADRCGREAPAPFGARSFRRRTRRRARRVLHRRSVGDSSCWAPTSISAATPIP